MKYNKINYLNRIFLLAMILLLNNSCERDLSDEAVLATYSKTPEIFIDSFSGGLGYGAFGGSKYTAFTVDTSTKYEGSASMRFDVPNFGDPDGAYAGGTFIDGTGRDLTDYNALTFWVKATKSATLNEVGFGVGINFGEDKFKVTLQNVPMNTNWIKVIIPIPDASKLTKEKGLFWYAEGPENNEGYTFWIDNVKYEKLGTITTVGASILNGLDVSEASFVGAKKNIDGLTFKSNLPNGMNQAVSLSASYFTFSSSDSSVATVSDAGEVTVLKEGNAVITATLGGKAVPGSLILDASGGFVNAPNPTLNPADVISVYSDFYSKIAGFDPGKFAGPNTGDIATQTNSGNEHISYQSIDFIGMGWNGVINASSKNTIHLDVRLISAASPNLVLELKDFGSDGIDNNFAAGGDTAGGNNISSKLIKDQWVGIDIPLDQFTLPTGGGGAGNPNKNNLGFIILVSNNGTSFLVDNIYFYSGNSVPTPIASVPTVAAPTPTVNAANVISIFSNAYTDVAGTNFTPNWQQSTVASVVDIAGNSTLKYAGLTYQGIEIGSNQNVSSKTTLHLDYYSANASSLQVFLISPASPASIEVSYNLTVPTSGTNGWNSIDIPLSSFNPVDLSNVFQFKFVGNGNVYIDNIYFKN